MVKAKAADGAADVAAEFDTPEWAAQVKATPIEPTPQNRGRKPSKSPSRRRQRGRAASASSSSPRPHRRRQRRSPSSSPLAHGRDDVHMSATLLGSVLHAAAAASGSGGSSQARAAPEQPPIPLQMKMAPIEKLLRTQNDMLSNHFATVQGQQKEQMQKISGCLDALNAIARLGESSQSRA